MENEQTQEIVLQNLEIELAEVSKLQPHPKNPNMHTSQQIAEIINQFKHQGVRQFIVGSKLSGFIVAGCGRLEAAKLAGFKQFPVAWQEFKDEAHEYEYMVADNAIADWSTLNFKEIHKSLEDLGPEIDLDRLGILNFDVSGAPQDSLKEIEELTKVSHKLATCPDCGHEFEVT